MKDSPPDQRLLLEIRSISKSFPGVRALKDVSLHLYKGEVLALLGENGAGKSTLMKILGGAYSADAGEILIEGHAAYILSPTDAQLTGISVIYEEFNLFPELKVYENIFLGRENTRMRFVNASEESRQARALFKKIGIDIHPGARCGDLSVAQQQTVEIAKALSVNARLIVMDEPSSALTIQEVGHLFKIIRDLRNQGIGIIYISHLLEEIFELADRVMVLRDGEHVGTQNMDVLTREQLIEKMVGRSLESEFPKRDNRLGEERLRVEHLPFGSIIRDISFHVRSGEVLGFVGLVGAGRTETMSLIFGVNTPDSGRIFINNREVKIREPRDAIQNRIGFLPEDRKIQGLVLIHTCRENFGLPNLDHYVTGMFIDRKKESRRFADHIQNLKIKVVDQEQLAMNLSGGNQQKLVLAKLLERNSDIIIFDEPTRGIDVGAKYQIYLLINRLAAEGKAAMIISSELPEILGMSDHIIVMHEGRIKDEITDVTHATQEDILAMAIA